MVFPGGSECGPVVGDRTTDLELSAVDGRALDIETELEKHRAASRGAAKLDQLGEVGAIDRRLERHRRLAQRRSNVSTIDLLDPALANGPARKVGALDLATEHEELATFEPCPPDRGHYIREAGTGGDERKGPSATTGCIEVFAGDARRHFVDERHAFHAFAYPVEQVHDVPARDEEAVRVAELLQPLRYQLGVLDGLVAHAGAPRANARICSSVLWRMS